jgi:thiosulfate/3-mercaptopyruvate sulfurtransferase
VKGWIPGAVHFDLYGISLNNTNPEPFASFMWMMEYLFSHRGVDHNKTVVLYEGISGMRAARGFWFLEYMGHEDVHLLDGGFKAWVAAGYPVSTEPVTPKETKFTAKYRPDLHRNADAVHDMLFRPDVAILDTRTDDEYYGRSVRAARGGTIPGAIHLEWVNNLNADGAFKSGDELRAMYEACGITRDKAVVPF